MGKELGKKKKEIITKRSNSNVKLSNVGVNSPRAYDMDTVVFISMAQEHKEEGNRLFQKRDYEGAMLKYEKALKLLPGNHIDVSHLHSNMAACYMQMGIVEYPRAIHECNLALEVTPKYSKALLKRARCYEGLNRLDLAFRDVSNVLKMEPNNVMAAEIEERLRVTMEKKGTKMSEEEISSIPVPEYVVFEPTSASTRMKSAIEKVRKKKSNKHTKKNRGENEDRIEEKEDEDRIEEKKYEDRIEEKEDEDRIEEKEDEDRIEEKEYEDRIEEKKNKDRFEKKNEENVEEKRDEEQVDEEKLEEKKAEDKLVVEEKISTISMDEEPKRILKLVFGEDIRFAKVPFNCSILNLREIIQDRFPSSKAILIKYRDQEGDLVTITTNEELRWAEACMEQHGSVKLYIVEVNPDQDPFFGKVARKEGSANGGGPHCIDDWIIQFAELFKNYVGFNSDAYLDLHELGMKVYSEAMEDTVTSVEAQELFHAAGDKFQEMAALALFNWGNVHLSKARKRVYFTEDASRESVLGQVKVSYDWAQKEYTEAGNKYEEALKIKPDFYEGVLALGQQQFEQAKLSWYYAVGTNVDLETWNSSEVLQLYNYAEDNMERGMQMWEEAEKQRINEVSRPSKGKILLQKVHSDGFIKDVTADEAAEQAANMRSQINLLWGTMLYERSIMEYKLGLPVWHECLEVAVEKFELAGASPTDIAVMVKNHCSNDTTLEGNLKIMFPSFLSFQDLVLVLTVHDGIGLGFNIDEIVQAWNEMYEAKRWQSGVPSFRLEPLLRRRVSKLYHALEHT